MSTADQMHQQRQLRLARLGKLRQALLSRERALIRAYLRASQECDGEAVEVALMEIRSEVAA